MKRLYFWRGATSLLPWGKSPRTFLAIICLSRRKLSPPSCVICRFPPTRPLRQTALLNRETCRTASRLCTLIFQPALMVSSMGSTLTLSSLQESWQLVVAAMFTILTSFATAWLFGRVFLRSQDRSDFMPVQLAIAFPNAGAFPLLLMNSLCEQDLINRWE